MASVVAAAAAALLVGGLVAANRSAGLRIEQALSTQLLANQLALLGDQIADDTPTQGAFPEPLGTFSWSLEYADASPDPLTHVTLAVAHDGHEAHVVTYRRLAEQ